MVVPRTSKPAAKRCHRRWHLYSLILLSSVFHLYLHRWAEVSNVFISRAVEASIAKSSAITATSSIDKEASVQKDSSNQVDSKSIMDNLSWDNEKVVLDDNDNVGDDDGADNSNEEIQDDDESDDNKNNVGDDDGADNSNEEIQDDDESDDNKNDDEMVVDSNDSDEVDSGEDDDAKMPLPQWMEEYFSWHESEMKQLNEQNWQDHKFLILRCLEKDQACGGLADRLRTMPFIVFIAARTKRILFIEWERPAPLSEFLVPPTDVPAVLDWRMPAWMKKLPWSVNLGFERHYNSTHSDSTFVNSKFQLYGIGADQYNKQLGANEPDYNTVLRRVWLRMFEPVPPIQKMINEEEDGLPDDFVSVQLRTRYVVPLEGKALQDTVNKAIKCATSLSTSNETIYVTADSSQARILAEELSKKLNRRIIPSTMDNTTDEPLHLDRGNEYVDHKRETGWTRHPVEQYYGIFRDLYMLSKGRCMAHDRGGFGELGALLGERTLSCTRSHFRGCK